MLVNVEVVFGIGELNMKKIYEYKIGNKMNLYKEIILVLSFNDKFFLSF